MKKTTLLSAIILLLACVSVQAQKGNRMKPIDPPVKNFLSVQDQTGGGFIMFDLVTGDFKCNMCEYNMILKGTGQVKVDGFNVSLTAVTDNYQMFVTLNMWDRQGKAVIEVFPADAQTDLKPIQEFWTDLNIDDNSLSCTTLPPIK